MTTKLIYQDGSSNKFWQIRVEKHTHTVTYGRVGTDGTSKTKEFADNAAAIKDATKLIKAKKKKGYKEAAEKAKIIRDSYTFAGKPIKNFTNSFKADTAVKVLSGYDEELKVVDKLNQLAKLPNIAELDTLVIGSWQESWEKGPSKILDKLIELKDTFSGLRHLFIGDMDSEENEMSWIYQLDYSSFYPHFPALESFGVRGAQELKLGSIDLPNLKNLIIETGGLNVSVIKEIIQSNLNDLEHLEVWLGTDEYGCNISVEDLQSILNGKFSNLRFLGLKNYYKQNELVKALEGVSVLNNLNTLDVSMGILKDDGAAALYNNDALLNLKHINCRHHFISSDWMKKLKTKFAAQNINLEDQEEPYDEDYYYVEIGE